MQVNNERYDPFAEIEKALVKGMYLGTVNVGGKEQLQAMPRDFVENVLAHFGMHSPITDTARLVLYKEIQKEIKKIVGGGQPTGIKPRVIIVEPGRFKKVNEMFLGIIPVEKEKELKAFKQLVRLEHPDLIPVRGRAGKITSYLVKDLPEGVSVTLKSLDPEAEAMQDAGILGASPRQPCPSPRVLLSSGTENILETEIGGRCVRFDKADVLKAFAGALDSDRNTSPAKEAQKLTLLGTALSLGQKKGVSAFHILKVVVKEYKEGNGTTLERLKKAIVVALVRTKALPIGEAIEKGVTFAETTGRESTKSVCLNPEEAVRRRLLTDKEALESGFLDLDFAPLLKPVEGQAGSYKVDGLPPPAVVLKQSSTSPSPTSPRFAVRSSEATRLLWAKIGDEYVAFKREDVVEAFASAMGFIGEVNKAKVHRERYNKAEIDKILAHAMLNRLVGECLNKKIGFLKVLKDLTLEYQEMIRSGADQDPDTLDSARLACSVRHGLLPAQQAVQQGLLTASALLPGTVSTVTIPVGEMAETQVALDVILGAEGKQGKVLASYTYNEERLQNELLGGQTWPNGKPFESPSGQLIRDVVQTKVHMRGGALIKGENERSKIAAVATELRSAIPFLTDRQVYILMELMTQTASSSLSKLMMGPEGEWRQSLMQQMCMIKVDSSSRDIEYALQGNKAVVTIHMTLQIVSLTLLDERGNPLVLKTADSIQTCTLDLNPPPDGDKIIEVRNERSGYRNVQPVTTQEAEVLKLQQTLNKRLPPELRIARKASKPKEGNVEDLFKNARKGQVDADILRFEIAAQGRIFGGGISAEVKKKAMKSDFKEYFKSQGITDEKKQEELSEKLFQFTMQGISAPAAKALTKEAMFDEEDTRNPDRFLTTLYKEGIAINPVVEFGKTRIEYRFEGKEVVFTHTQHAQIQSKETMQGLIEAEVRTEVRVKLIEPDQYTLIHSRGPFRNCAFLESAFSPSAL